MDDEPNAKEIVLSPGVAEPMGVAASPDGNPGPAAGITDDFGYLVWTDGNGSGTQ